MNAKDKIMFEDMKRYFLLSSPDVGGGDGGGRQGSGQKEYDRPGNNIERKRGWDARH